MLPKLTIDFYVDIFKGKTVESGGLYLNSSKYNKARTDILLSLI